MDFLFILVGSFDDLIIELRKIGDTKWLESIEESVYSLT